MYWILRHKLWDHFKTHRCRDRGPSHEGGNDFHGNSWSCFWSQKGQWILGIWSNLPVVCPENGMIPRCSSNQWPGILAIFLFMICSWYCREELNTLQFLTWEIIFLVLVRLGFDRSTKPIELMRHHLYAVHQNAWRAGGFCFLQRPDAIKRRCCGWWVQLHCVFD